MPLIRQGASVTPPVSSGGGTGRPAINAPALEPLPVITYTDADGVDWTWTNDASTGFALLGATGLGSPPVSADVRPLPGGGAYVADVVPEPAVVNIALDVFADDPATFRKMLRGLRRALTHKRAGAVVLGTLTVTWGDGARRSLDVLCIDGPPQVDSSPDTDTQVGCALTLSFVGPEGYWRDADEQHRVFGLAAGGGGIPPLLPIVLSPGNLLGDVTIDNEGDAETYPRWVITGPGTPTILNNTTGEGFAFDVVLAAGETRTIDTTPALQTIVDGDGVNCWGDLADDPAPSLFALEPGENDLTVELAGAGPGSLVDLYYVRKWLGT